MRRAEAEAFAFSDQEVLAGLLPFLKEGRLRLDELPVTNAAEAVRVLTDPAHAAGVRADLAIVRAKLGSVGASRRAAEAVLEVARNARA